MNAPQSTYRFFAATSPGLESLLQAELAKLGIVAELTKGGVDFTGTQETLWCCSAQSRIAESIRLRLKPFRATSFSELERGLARLPWHAYLHPHQPVEVRVSCSESKLYHTGAIEERLRAVLASTWQNRAGSKESVRSAEEPPKLYVRIARNEVCVSVDATGTRLHRRGYRTHVGAAPLRETLAAAACRILEDAAKDNPTARLWDPCCGSATLLCEWLQLKAGTWPALATGHMREFGFEGWPIHPLAQFERWRSEQVLAVPDAEKLGSFRAFGSDIDARVLSAARNNLERAQLLAHSTLIHADFRQAASAIPRNTALATNLPYGVRLTDSRTRVSPFATLDTLLRERDDLRPAVVITTELPPRHSRNAWKAAARFSNGGLAVSAWLLS